MHDRSLDWMNRGHHFDAFLDAVQRSQGRGLDLCAHVILGLPGETHGHTGPARGPERDRKSTRLNSSHTVISYAVFCLKKNNTKAQQIRIPRDKSANYRSQDAHAGANTQGLSTANDVSHGRATAASLEASSTAAQAECG